MTDRQTDRQTELAWHICAIAYMLLRVKILSATVLHAYFGAGLSTGWIPNPPNPTRNLTGAGLVRISEKWLDSGFDEASQNPVEP